MKATYQTFLYVVVFGLVRSSSPDLFNLTLMMPSTNELRANQSVYVARKFPDSEELYIVDFHPVFNRQKVRSITTYLCSQPYLTTGDFWFDHKPCHSQARSLMIYEWYHSIPALQWPKDAGLQAGTGTSYRYVVVHIQFSSPVPNGSYGEQITLTRRRPKYRIASYDMVPSTPDVQNDHADFACEFHSSTVQLFSALFHSDLEGRSVSLYRVRKNRPQTIIKGNLSWPQTFYQLPNVIDIKTSDLLIGRCIYATQSLNRISARDPICQVTLMFFTEQDNVVIDNECQRSDLSRLVDRLLPSDSNDVPQTLFDINPAYPKLSPNEWATMQTSSPSKPVDNNTHILYLIYSNDGRHQELISLLHSHRVLIIICIWLLLLLLGLVILVFVIVRSRRTRKYAPIHKKRSKAITVGGETSSLSGWLTKRRFQQYEDDDETARAPLTRTHRWASDTEGSELSDAEVFNATDFRHVVLRN